MYVSDNKGTLPASYLYVGHKVIGGVQSPDKPVNGYVHWSSFIFATRRAKPSLPPAVVASGSPATTRARMPSTSGWEAFQCPSLDNGGLPPTDPANGLGDSSVPSDVPGYSDYQAPRLLTRSTNHFAAQQISHRLSGYSAHRAFCRAVVLLIPLKVILGTEWNQSASVVQATGEVSGAMVLQKPSSCERISSTSAASVEISTS